MNKQRDMITTTKNIVENNVSKFSKLIALINHIFNFQKNTCDDENEKMNNTEKHLQITSSFNIRPAFKFIFIFLFFSTKKKEKKFVTF